MFEAGAGTTRIDVRSVWFLLLYASEYLDRLTGRQRERLLDGERDNDLLDALADELSRQVGSRLRSMLSRGYRTRTDSLTRVRGRIDHLGTTRRRLMDSGHVLCHYEEMTSDLPRYRFMLVTLRNAARSVLADDVRRRCTQTVQMLERAGVRPFDATPLEMSREQYGHHDAADKNLVLLSRLVRTMCAPEHTPGRTSLPTIVHNDHAMRKLFERAVLGFYRFHLGPRGYDVAAESRPWPAEGCADAIAQLPRLNADVVLRNVDRQVIVECKFAPIFDTYRGKTMIKPSYLRQLYAYASVFAQGDRPTEAVLLGALVHGSEGQDMDVSLDGFPLRVRQVDLARSPSVVRAALVEATSMHAREMSPHQQFPIT